MLLAIVDHGVLQVFNSDTGKIIAGAIEAYRPAEPDRRTDIAIGLLNRILEKVDNMSQTQDTIAAEVAALKSNMGDLHTAVSGIQARLEAAIAAAGGSTDPSVLSDLAGVNADLKSVVGSLSSSAAAPAPASTGPATDPASAPQPVVAEPAPATAVVFDASNTAPNAPGGRNSSQLPNFDSSVPETA